MRRTPRVLVAGLVVLVLPAWAADPPAAEPGQVPEAAQEVIERLYRERIDWLNHGSEKYLGEGAKKLVIRFEQLQKSDCESELKGVYRCRVLIEFAIGPGPSQTRRQILTLAHDGNDWRLK